MGRHFVLDPIDGTRGFVAMRQYAVCLAMLEDGKVMRVLSRVLFVDTLNLVFCFSNLQQRQSHTAATPVC